MFRRRAWVRSLGWEDPLEKGKATHSSILAWRIPWTTVHGVAKSQTRLSDFHSTLILVEVKKKRKKKKKHKKKILVEVNANLNSVKS